MEYIILGGLLKDKEISVLIVVGNSRESCCLCFGKGGVNCDSWICVEDCPNFLLPCVHVYMIWMNKMPLFNFKKKKKKKKPNWGRGFEYGSLYERWNNITKNTNN